MVRFGGHVAGCIIVDVSVVGLLCVLFSYGVKCIGLLHRFYSTLLEWKWRRLLAILSAWCRSHA